MDKKMLLIVSISAAAALISAAAYNDYKTIKRKKEVKKIKEECAKFPPDPYPEP